MSIAMPTCAACGLTAFPPHLRCARCGSLAWTTTAVQGGTLEYLTVVRRTLAPNDPARRPPTIAVVATDSGPRVIALLVNGTAGAQAGATVTLTQDGTALLATLVRSDSDADGAARARP